MCKVIIITGSRKGIGKYLCEHYLSQGNIVIGCSRGEKSIEHSCYTHYCLDVFDEKSVITMVREVYNTYSKIDVLLNNAGIASMNHLITTPFKTVESIFHTNVLGSFIFLREVSKIMMKQKKGRIINFTTVAVPLNIQGEAIYAASKSAIETLTKISAKELGPFGITVNAIGPTPISTDLIKVIPKYKIETLLEYQAIKRMGNFIDVFNCVDFFIQDSSDFITGQILYLGGIN